MRRLLWVGLVVATGCAARKTTIASTDDVPRDQWSRGVYLYGQHCARCHGEEGEGDGDAPPLVGDGALPLEPREGSERTQPFRTAGDLFSYVKDNMPPLEPESVNEADTWAILAVILKDNGVEAPDPLGPDSAESVALRR